MDALTAEIFRSIIDQTNSLMKVEQRFSSTYLSTASTFNSVKAAAGFLHAVIIGNASTPTITLYDRASGASGTIIAQFTQTPASGFIVNASFLNGLTVNVGPGVAPQLTLSYR